MCLFLLYDVEKIGDRTWLTKLTVPPARFRPEICHSQTPRKISLEPPAFHRGETIFEKNLASVLGNHNNKTNRHIRTLSLVFHRFRETS